MRTYPTPYLLCAPETDLSVGGTLMLVPPGVVDLAEMPKMAKPDRVERILFAYRIPYLPDLLTSPHLAGQNERERLAEVLDRQARLVANLGKWKEMAFSLRYLSQPERGKVEITLVARGIARVGHGRRLGEEMASDVAALLRSFDFPAEPVTGREELKSILEPFPQPLVLEIRQHEEIVSLLQGDAYAVYPFRPPVTTWIATFETLLHQRAPCLINIHLEPTLRYDHERQLFAQASALAETLSDFTFEGLAYRGHLADPQAKVVARLYTDYLQRLTEPFLLVVQVTTPRAHRGSSRSPGPRGGDHRERGHRRRGSEGLSLTQWIRRGSAAKQGRPGRGLAHPADPGPPLLGEKRGHPPARSACAILSMPARPALRFVSLWPSGEESLVSRPDSLCPVMRWGQG